jgi:excisionase family DNA binding protein
MSETASRIQPADGSSGDSTHTPSHRLLTAEEVAAILRVPKSWVYSHQNQLPTIRLGRYVRFRRVDIEELLVQRSTC